MLPELFRRSDGGLSREAIMIFASGARSRLFETLAVVGALLRGHDAVGAKAR